jgi:predicted lipid-binding transport protein (Tim44 family)
MTDSESHQHPADEAGSLEPHEERSPLLYNDLVAPAPADPTPPAGARWLAFGSILLGGLLGGLIGYGTADLMVDSSLWVAVGGLVGAIAGAVGVGVVAMLTLRAMNEWKSVDHPESETRAASGLVLRDDTTSNGLDPSDGEPTAAAPDDE